MTQLWAKSREAHTAFTARGLRSTLTGFASRDLRDPQVPRQLACLHLRGHSGLKGTEQVLAAWATNRDLPPLTVVSAVPLNVPAGVVVRVGRLPHADLVREMNRHSIHVCPSRSEGWGHYITEAMSVGATVVTTDASPMNEHVQPGRGVLVPASVGGGHNLAQLHEVTAAGVADAVRRAAGLDGAVRERMGSAARAHIVAGNDAFRRTVVDLVGGL
jgi:glycosyltransferase involved in cell wall biosynthesis